jgi:hypothetical protein
VFATPSPSSASNGVGVLKKHNQTIIQLKTSRQRETRFDHPVLLLEVWNGTCCDKPHTREYDPIWIDVCFSIKNLYSKTVSCRLAYSNKWFEVGYLSGEGMHQDAFTFV